uniref:Uncharacterized protein n=1 Tax=Nelumbo nucifera TaxID=4432 RepID=A0A822ZF69_NELNU|nr:TPA_asm: hypothetical protein HUJ06_014571 [Nelumbo nucifera]
MKIHLINQAFADLNEGMKLPVQVCA